MAAKVGKTGDEINVTYEDQQKINKFARHNAKMVELKEELEAKKKALQNLEDAADELVLLEGDDEPIPYQIGEVFVSTTAEEANDMLEAAKTEIQDQIKGFEAGIETHKGILSDLKINLYAKFGNNINLEAEEGTE